MDFKMKSYLRKNPGWTSNFRCPKCGKCNKRCSMTEDGVWLNCYEVFDGAIKVKEGLLGQYGVHLLKPEAQSRLSQYSKVLTSSLSFVGTKNSQKMEASVPSELYDQVYSALLDAWNLSEEHKQHLLLERCLSLVEIERQRYKTSGVETSTMEKLSQKFGEDLMLVPGFSKRNGMFHFCSSGQLVIPTQTVHGKVINIRIRRNAEELFKNPDLPKYFYASSAKFGGPKAKLSHHFVQGTADFSSKLWITEGEIKAHIISHRLGVNVISIPGVSLWREALAALQYLSARQIVVAFDQDALQKKQVAQSLFQFSEALKKGGYDVEFAIW